MAVKIRLVRIGRRKKPFFRVVAVDSRKKSSSFIESVGFYDPTTNPSKIKINRQRITYWQSKGAILSATVENLLS